MRTPNRDLLPPTFHPYFCLTCGCHKQGKVSWYWDNTADDCGNLRVVQLRPSKHWRLEGCDGDQVFVVTWSTDRDINDSDQQILLGSLDQPSNCQQRTHSSPVLLYIILFSLSVSDLGDWSDR
ncbi:hypothetical protein RRG08_001934 [Elysia crispata]|uniref:Uncharacterized protein n=1 Tax=Elysia crispata TaxID=231223 RepID=A0AAE1BC92_9GAST|nr:hypothetical protein RRG08_001934 [Elysia crispata]